MRNTKFILAAVAALASALLLLPITICRSMLTSPMRAISTPVRTLPST